MFKISGEAMMGNKPFGHDLDAIYKIAKEIAEIHKLGIEVCVVVGGGNIFRGVSISTELMDRPSADYMGMLATVMNGIALQNMLEKNMNVETRMQTAIEINRICEPFVVRKAIKHLEEKRIVIFVAGTGNPYFTTDTASVLRASETGCNALFKGTQVNGVYDKDPKKYPDAKRYKTITYDKVIQDNLKIMESSAFILARDSNMPIVVFKLAEENAILNVVKGEGKYTLVSNNVENEFDNE